MPRDIRSYFVPVASSNKKNDKPSKSQKRHIISSDEDEEKPKSAKRSKVAFKTAHLLKKVHNLSDSEDDVSIAAVDQKNSKQSKISKKNEIDKSCEAISPCDLFSKKPVTRIEEIRVNQKLQKAEAEFHDDEDFEKVLKQLDSSHQQAMTQKKRKNKEVDFNESKKDKHISLENSYDKVNKSNKTKTKEKKRSASKNNAHIKTFTSSPLKKEKNGNFSSNEDLHTSNIDSSKTSNHNYLPDVSASVCKQDKDVEKQSPNRKKGKTVDLFEERIEKKKQRAILYEKYLQRGGARNPGSKKIPTGAKNCLASLSFLITGVLDSLERNEAEDLIQSYGGRTVNAVSGKVNYIIVGDEAGPAKLAKANNLGIKLITEDELLEMINTRPEGKFEDIKPVATRAKPNTKRISNKSENNISPSQAELPLISPKKAKTSVKEEISSLSLKQTSDISDNLQETNIGSQPLVEKYRPKTLKQIIGQQGDRSCAKNLFVWLRDWHKNRQDPKFKDGTGKQTNGQGFKAVLLSGPPGIGKTTTAQVVCKELGYDLLEFNASDTRNKTLLKEEISGLLSNTTMKDYLIGTKQKITSKHVLLMDEVDGMAGNEDRGGLQELINLIRYTEVPIICICNDRFNPRVKTISYHSYDLRFPKLRVEQIRSFMKSLCFKENIKISTEDLDRLIESTNYDIRQVINHLEFVGDKPGVTNRKKHSNKDFKLSPFDVAKMAFNAEEQKNMSLNDRISLYFNDYNIAPLFIEENYPNVRLSQVSPFQKLERLARAVDSISQGDLVEKVMRSNMMWSLLPLHACFSFVVPSSEMSGSLESVVRFPSWFGRNSKATKFNRLIQELVTHTRLVTCTNKDALNLDYLIHIRNAIIKPLVDNGTDGIEAAINVMGKYYLMREDLDSIAEISVWPGVRDLMNNLDSKVKAAFTRAYQKNPPMLPYTVNNSTARKRSAQNEKLTEEEEEEEEENDDDIDSDKMIKAKKPANKTAASTKKNGEPIKKRGRGRGKTK